MLRKLLLPLLAAGLALTLTSCKYNFKEVYRYPCQDPANWETPECTYPECEGFGICTKDVMRGTSLFDEDTEYQDASVAK